MLGYYRIPSEQPLLPASGCLEGAPSQAATQILTALQPFSPSRRILVAVGDNFAPHLLARTFAPVEKNLPRQEKDRYTFVGGAWKLNKDVTDQENVPLTAGKGSLPNDNVACFFRSAKYDAIVPGKHDFYFGPEHLRYLANLLDAPATNAEQPVKLLAANIAISTKVPDITPIPGYQKVRTLAYSTDPTPLMFAVWQSTNHNTGAAHGQPFKKRFASQLKAAIPDTVLPWLRTITVQHWAELVDLHDKSNPTPLNAGEITNPTIACVGSCPAADCITPTCLAQLTIENSAGLVGLRANAGAGWLCRGPQPNYSENAHRDADTLDGSRPPFSCKLLGLPASNNQPYSAGQPGSTKKPFSNDVVFELPEPLQNDTSYLVCFTAGGVPGANKNTDYCTSFSVHVPLLQYLHDNQLGAPLSPVSEKGGYTIKTVCLDPGPCSAGQPNAAQVAIFGVVDPDLRSFIGNLNYSWRNTRNKYETEIEVLDPVDALRQLFQTFEEQNPGFTGQKILLAQMPRYKAAEIGYKLKGAFSLIITQADPEHPTEDDESLIRHVTDTKSSVPGAFGPGLMLTPGYSYSDGTTQAAGTFNVQLNHAELTFPDRCGQINQSCTGQWQVTNHIPPGQKISDYVGNCAGSVVTLSDLIDKTLQGVVDQSELSSWSQQQKLQRLVLEAMRSSGHGDIALIQKHDLFEVLSSLSIKVCSSKLQDALDQILWKGDFLFPIDMKGSDLKKVMDRSAQYDAADRASTNFDANHDRGLLPLGIIKDPATKSYFVNGDILDDNRLYRVAITDYAGMGDTGYAEFASPVVPPARRVKDLETLHSISGLVCERIVIENSSLGRSACTDESIDARSYFDEIDQKPFDTSAGYTSWRHFVAWLRPALPPNRYKIANALETQVQDRPLFSLSLEKLDFNYQLNVHNSGSEKDVASLFSGIPNPQLTAAESNSLSFDYRLQAVRSLQRLDLFALSESYYSRTFTRQTSNDSFLQNQTQDLFAAEAGARPRLWPSHRQTPTFQGLISARFETQLLDPFTKFSLNTTPGSTLTGTTSRTKSLLGKFGLRFQDDKSWVESGFEVGERFGSPLAYIFNPGLPDQKRCELRAGNSPTSFLGCIQAGSTPTLSGPGPITSSSKFQPAVEDKLQDGLFLNFHLNIPLPIPLGSSFAYSMDNRGEIFFNRSTDLSIDTKFTDLWSHSLIIPVFGNFALVPKADFLFFQNKVDNHFFRSISTSLALQYRFDWHRGLEWRNALLYPTPAAKP
jgi:hypothetical protein